MAAASHIALDEAPFTGSLFAKIEALMTRFGQYRMYRLTLAELQTLNSRELDDLGLSGSSLKSIAHQAAYETH